MAVRGVGEGQMQPEINLDLRQGSCTILKRHMLFSHVPQKAILALFATQSPFPLVVYVLLSRGCACNTNGPR